MSEETQTKTITIQGIAFAVSEPYAEGHQVTEAEAKALNQVRSENIRNNCAKLVKAMKAEHGDDLPQDVLDSLAQQVAEYDADYQFTLASVGGGRKTRDPYEVEARKLARAALAGKIKELGKKFADYDKDFIDTKIAEIAEHPAIKKQAKRIVDDRNKMAEESLADLEL